MWVVLIEILDRHFCEDLSWKTPGSHVTDEPNIAQPQMCMWLWTVKGCSGQGFDWCQQRNAGEMGGCGNSCDVGKAQPFVEI